MRRVSSRAIVLLLALALVLAVAALAGCSEDDEASTSSPAASVAADKPADQIVEESEAKMATVGSASFTADVALRVQGDTTKMTDPATKALLGQGVTFNAKGKSAAAPTAADLTMSVGIAGQTLEFGFKATGAKAWVGYQGSWYALDRKNAEALDEQAQSGAAPTAQLKSMGIDPSTWGTEYSLAGVETLDGVQVYHVKASADPRKLAESLAKAAEDPALGDKLGGSGELGELGQGLTQDPKEVEELAKSLKDADVEYWIGVDDQYLYKARFTAVLDTTGQEDMEGVSGATVEGTVTMGDFDQPVDVTPPASAKRFDDFMTELFGNLFGGGELMF